MKLATLRDGSLDGSLVAVSRDLRNAVGCSDIAPNLRVALECWPDVEARLIERFETLEAGSADGAFAFEQGSAAAPLPRAPQLLDGSAFKTHGELMATAFGMTIPAGVYNDTPLMYQGTSDDLLGASDDVILPSEDDGIDFEGEVVVIVANIAMGASIEAARASIRLITLMNDVSLRNCVRWEVTTGFGFIQTKPRSSFAPVAVTPDELGASWRDGRVHLRLRAEWNESVFGTPSAGDMAVSFPELIAYAARRRTLGPERSSAQVRFPMKTTRRLVRPALRSAA